MSSAGCSRSASGYKVVERLVGVQGRYWGPGSRVSSGSDVRGRHWGRGGVVAPAFKVRRWVLGRRWAREISQPDGRSARVDASIGVCSRRCLMPFRPMILQGPEMLLAASSKQFDENGALVSEHYQKTLNDLMAALRAVS